MQKPRSRILNSSGQLKHKVKNTKSRILNSWGHWNADSKGQELECHIHKALKRRELKGQKGDYHRKWRQKEIKRARYCSQCTTINKHNNNRSTNKCVFLSRSNFPTERHLYSIAFQTPKYNSNSPRIAVPCYKSLSSLKAICLWNQEAVFPGEGGGGRFYSVSAYSLYIRLEASRVSESISDSSGVRGENYQTKRLNITSISLCCLWSPNARMFGGF